MNELLPYFNVYPDFPKPGINFYDIQSALARPNVWNKINDRLCELVRDNGAQIVLGAESRGFVTGVPVALKLGLPFGMIRKPGKLPGEVVKQEYELEYGTDAIELQKGLIKPWMKVAILDDLMATGGTMKASADLVKKLGGEVVLGACVIELYELKGRDKMDFAFEGLVQAPLVP